MLKANISLRAQRGISLGEAEYHSDSHIANLNITAFRILRNAILLHVAGEQSDLVSAPGLVEYYLELLDLAADVDLDQ